MDKIQKKIWESIGIYILLIAFLFTISNKFVYAGTSTIESENTWYDWSTVDQVYVTGTENISSIATACDGDSVYLLVEETGYLGAFTQGQAKLGFTTNMGLVYKLDILSMDYQTYKLTFRNSNQIDGYGTRLDQGCLKYEIRIPITELWSDPRAIKTISLIWANNEQEIISIENPWYQESTEPTPDINVSTELKIDGYFGDWTYLPAYEITYQGHNNADNHNGSIYLYDDKLYVRFKMNRIYQSQMMVSYMNLKIDNKQVALTIQGANGDQVNWGVNMYSLPVGITGGTSSAIKLGVFTNEYPKVYLGPAAMSIYSAQHDPGDECEFVIDLDILASYLGVVKEELATTTFSINNPNIGVEWLTIVGSPTYPVVFFLGIIPVIIVIAYMKSKGKHKNA